MFFFVILAIWAVMHLYVFWRVGSLPFVQKHVPRWVLLLLAFFLASSYLLSRVVRGVSFLARTLEFIGANWVGVIFLAFVCFLVVDLVTGFGLLFRRKATRLRIGAVLACLLLSSIALIQGLRPPSVQSYEVRLRGLPPQLNGTVIVMMSDLHLGSLLGEDWLAARISQVKGLHPDMIVLGGDILEGDDPSEAGLLPKLRELSAPLGVWAVAGNHESYGNRGAPNHSLERAGIHVLRNQWMEIQPGLTIAGVEDLTHIRRTGISPNVVVSKALAERPAGTTTIFVSHSPVEAENASSKGVSLMLSGHTHNGQIWPFNYVVQQIYPRIAGEYNVGEMTLIVCRGTGTWGPRMRLWRRGEIVKITLRAS